MTYVIMLNEELLYRFAYVKLKKITIISPLSQEQLKRMKKSAFNVVTEQIAVLVSYKITDQIKWVCLHCTIAVSHVHMETVANS